MIADMIDLALGVGGTVAYLYAWNVLRMRVSTPNESGAARRRRQRLVQTVFFVLMTPYILFLFWSMERIREALGAGSNAP
jgi:hypothetical protein